MKIYSIVYQPGPSSHETPYKYNRVAVDTANLITDHGIEGDRKAGRNKTRQLNIMSYETLAELATQGYKTAPGQMGEQIIIQGLDVSRLSKGTQLQLGSDAVIEITKPRTGCSWFQEVQEKSQDIDLGMLARVIHSGQISIHDKVVVVTPDRIKNR